MTKLVQGFCSPETIEAILAVLLFSVADTKYSKVRIAALECLISICKHQEGTNVKANASEIRSMLKAVAADPLPAVLEAAARAQKEWLALS